MSKDNIPFYDELIHNDIPFYDELNSSTLKYDNIFEEFERREDEGNFFDSSYLTDFDDRANPEIREIVAQRQPWLHKAGAGVGRLVTKVGAELAKMPGVAGGIVDATIGQLNDLFSGQDSTDFMKSAFDNEWINTVQDAEEYIKEEILPVYVKKAVSEGNLWDNITAIDFWATEGADGLGYITSMLVPGAVINRFNLGSKLLAVDKLTKMAKTSQPARQAMNAIGYNAKNANVFTATVANTIFEAGAEAKSAMDSYTQELDRRFNLSEDDPDKLSQEEYESKKTLASQVGANVFKSNAAILFGPNLIMSKILWGGPRNKTPNRITSNNGKLEYKTLGLKQRIRNAGNDYVKAGAREGFFEEGMQSAAETYFTENPDNTFGDFIGGDFAKAYVDMLNTTEGQKAIFLGMAFGGGMQAYQGYKESGKENKIYNQLAASGNKTLESFYDLIQDDIYKRNDQGEVIYTTNEEGNSKPEMDALKVKEKLQSFMQIESISDAYDFALLQGDTETVKDLQDVITTNLIKGFIYNQNLGLDVLQEHLNASMKLQSIPEEVIANKAEFVQNIMDKARYLQKEYNLINGFSDNLLDFNNVELPNEHKVRLVNKKIDEYVNLKSKEYLIENKSKQVNQKLNDLIASKGIDMEIYDQNERLKNDLRTTDKRFRDIDADIVSIKQAEEDIKKQINNFFSDKSLKKSVTDYAKDYKKTEETAKREKEVDEVLEQVKNAKTQDELDNIESPFEEANTIVGEAKSNKSNELSAVEAQENDNIKETNEDYIVNESNIQETSIPEKKDIYETEGNLETEYQELEQIDTSGNIFESASQPRIIITDNNTNAQKLDFISDAALEFERAPVNKIGQQKNIEINNKQFININDLEKFVEYDRNLIQRKDSNETLINLEKSILKNGITTPLQLNVYHDKAILVEGNHRFAIAKKLNITNIPVKIINATDNLYLDDGLTVNPTKILHESYYNKAKPFDKNLLKNNFSINQNKAILMYENNDVSDMEFLIDNLPINVKLTDDITAPLETKSKSKSYNKIFNESSRPLRSTIIKEIMINKVDPSNIKIKIDGQWNGELQLDGIKENNVFDLYDFDSNINKVTSDKIYVVNDNFDLVNTKDNFLVNPGRRLAKGEVYIKIKTAAGNDFPLKLNIAKVTPEQADVLYDIYKHRFINREGGKAIRLVELHEALQNKIKDILSSELKVYEDSKKSFDQLTLKDIIDILIFDGTNTNNKKSRIRFYKDNLLLGPNTLSDTEFNSTEGKNKFIDFLVNDKRRNIKFKKRNSESDNAISLDNRSYLNYLLENKILNTNAKVNDFTFAGKTTMYLGKDSVTVNGKLSQFNKDVKKVYKSNLLGSNKKLHQMLPQMKSNPVKLNEDGSAYVDAQGNKYQRVSTLKDKDPNLDKINVYNAAKRGDVTDELLRLFFTKEMTESEFLQYGKDILDDVNKNKPKSTINIADSYYKDLFNIYTVYKNEFDKRNYTIFPNSNPLKGKLGVEGNFAGTMDLLAYDNTNKEWIIIDLKTSTIDRNEYYSGNQKDIYGYIKKDLIQQNAYKELFNQVNDIQPSKLLILPLVSKADTESNDAYSEVKLSSTNLFLEVDSTKDIYEVANIKKKFIRSKANIDKFNLATDDQGNIDVADPNANENIPSGVIDNDVTSILSKGGIEIPEEFKKAMNQAPPTPKVTPKKTTNTFEFSDNDTIAFVTDIQNAAYIEVDYDGQTYVLGMTSYIISTQEGPIADYDLTLKIIKEYNKDKSDKFAFDIKNVENVWKSRLNNVSLQDSSDIDYSKLSDDKANKAITVLLTSNTKYIKDINRELAKAKTPQNKLKNVVNYLVSKGESRDNIKTKCNI